MAWSKTYIFELSGSGTARYCEEEICHMQIPIISEAICNKQNLKQNEQCFDVTPNSTNLAKGN